MKNIKIYCKHEDTGEEKSFTLLDIVSNMGSQGAGDWSLEEEVGEELAWLYNEFEHLQFTIGITNV